jgi:hypothetical protein
VTLKVINKRYLGDESARLRFLREARAAAAVRSPPLIFNNPGVRPYTNTDGDPFV